MWIIPQFYGKWGLVLDKRIIKTKESIQNAYFTLLVEKKSPKITISEIARKANIDRKTFYLHYDTINSMIEEFCENKIKELLEILNEIQFNNSPFNVEIFFSALNQLIMFDINVYRTIANNSEFYSFWNKIKEILIQTIIDDYKEKLNLSSDELIIYSNLYASGIMSVYLSWLKNDIQVNISDLGRLTSEAIYYGIQKPLSTFME